MSCTSCLKTDFRRRATCPVARFIFTPRYRITKIPSKSKFARTSALNSSHNLRSQVAPSKQPCVYAPLHVRTYIYIIPPTHPYIGRKSTNGDAHLHSAHSVFRKVV